MTVPGSATTPREFGAALRAAREERGIRLDVIAERTKIGKRLLEALEDGEFAKLPNRVFVRLFLQQYLGLINERDERWLTSFDAAWQRFEDASQPWEIAPPAPSRGTRAIPWVIGGVVVAAGLLTVAFIERRQSGGGPEITTPVPEMVLPTRAAPPVEIAPTPEPTVEPTDPSILALRAGDRPCWVEVRIADELPESRLLAPGEAWSVDAGGREVALVAGDAGALRVEYLGEVRDPVGNDGQVVHLQLGPGPPTEVGTTP